jgi:hypothetical protein
VTPITDDDLDRLADYTAGLLDPVEAAEVDRLIATDDGWARAHEALIAAQPLVDRALAQLPEERMPADVAARLDRALHNAATGTGPATGTGSNVIDLGQARRWRRAALATTAVAAAVAACVGGLVALGGSHVLNGSGSNTSAGAPAGAPRAPLGVGSVPVLVSGTDYTHVQLATPPALSGNGLFSGGAADARAPSVGAAPPAGRANADSVPASTAVPAELARLTDPTQLRACLDAIVAVDRGQPTSVDYARYKGSPALIVTLAVGPVTAVAVGPSCGLPGAGAAIIDSAG